MHPMKAPFTRLIVEANRIDPENFQTWAFRKEMLFNAPGKWWGDLGQRDFPHEGIDLCLYCNRSGEVCRLGHKTRIPVMNDGVVKAVFKDYLGQAIVIEHTFAQEKIGRFISAYAHTVPQKGIAPGARVHRGDIIAHIADTRMSKAKIHPHLHFSIGRPSGTPAYDNFVWNMMRDPELVTLLDPLEIMDPPFQVVDAKMHLHSPYPE